MSVLNNSRNNESSVRGTILLVEDEPFLREATTRLLQKAGFQVLAAIDAQDALTHYEQHRGRVDVLMSDLGLPGRSGLELGRDLRQSAPGLPILLTSGFLGRDDEDGLSDETIYYLPKPYSRAELVAMLEQILTSLILRRAVAG